MARMAKARVPPAEDAREELARRVEALQSDLSALADSLKAVGMEQINSTQNSIREAVDTAGRAVNGAVKMTEAEAQHLGEAAAEKIGAAGMVIGRNPLTAVLVSIGLGFVVGKISRH